MVTKQLRMARDHGVAETIVLEGSREGSLEEVSNKLHFRERRNFKLSKGKGLPGKPS